jgi:hypothetical protein
VISRFALANPFAQRLYWRAFRHLTFHHFKLFMLVRSVECSMPVRVKKRHSALKHGAYSATTILPGERAAEFEKLHRNLIAELTPEGALEDDIVATIARLLWRKQNLAKFRNAKRAGSRFLEIGIEKLPWGDSPSLAEDLNEDDPNPADEAIRAAEDQTRKEFGDDVFELVDMGEMGKIESIMSDFELQDRLDALVEKSLKRLLFVRGLKSISAPSSSPPPKPRVRSRVA